MIPIFRSNFSLTSILTVEPASENKDANRPDSIFDICKENSLKEAFIVDNTLTGLVDAYENAKKSEIKLRFGYRVDVCHDMEDKSLESKNTTSKLIIFAAETSFDKLIHLHNLSTTKGAFLGSPRLDYKTLSSLWDKSLVLAVPFYDSHIHYNLLHGRTCVPDLDFTDPFYFSEENGLPFDSLIQEHLTKSIDKSKIVPSKTIYYNKRCDFKSYMAYRCILNRTSFQKPELQHFGSTEFCMQSLLEAEK
jgi:DNA polymerase III alpha subunit